MSAVFQTLAGACARRRLLAATALLLLAACGQKGPLYLPTGEAAVGRLTLPQTLEPSTAVVPAAAASSPPTGTAAPLHNTQ